MKILFFVLSLTFPFFLHAQYIAKIGDTGALTVDPAEKPDFYGVKILNSQGQVEKLARILQDCDSFEGKKEIPLDKDIEIKVIVDCEKNEIVISKIDGSGTETVYYCAETKKYQRGKPCEVIIAEGNSLTDITQIPVPVFQSPKNNSQFENHNNRYLIINADPNKDCKSGGLYKIKMSYNEKEGYKFQKATALPINKRLSVFIDNYNLHDIEDVTIKVDGEEYSYGEDISVILSGIKNLKKESADSTEKSQSASTSNNKNENNNRLSARHEYLKYALESLKSHEALNINDLYILQAFKKKLEEIVQNKENKIELTLEERKLRDEILHWFPSYISLTPSGILTPETDEVEVKMLLKEKNVTKAKEYTIGRYKTSGGMAVNVGSMIYITGLKNNEIYTEKDSINGQEELRAKIDSTSQTSIGIGLNTEISFRTGTIIRPALNVGFFVPFEEELSPFLTLGGGFSFSDKNVRLGLSAGLALGKVNRIAERFQGQDLNQFEDLTNEKIAQKVWNSSWYAGIGVSFNLNEKKKKKE